QHFGLPTSSALGEDSAMRVSLRRLPRSRGQMYRLVTAIPADGPIASDVSCKTCVWSRSVIHFALVQVFLPSQRVNRLMEKNMGSGSGSTYPSARASRPGLAREGHRKAGIKRY